MGAEHQFGIHLARSGRAGNPDTIRAGTDHFRVERVILAQSGLRSADRGELKTIGPYDRLGHVFEEAD